ncbi:MAG: hypothetical protein AVDCRST_MAG14-572 [uncultured Rubrobacteraceae bacterium]|uniref:HEAT repeat domain-containing protein n=1 Tax=uncultured Rubrobacteraceae bacterium TaxID=349277 RepID=A0A6J4QKU7_9ACTN|nr:MAG: hypothetical protein AVDCRST_MAG14-572 [uncultured Rubrobacteraceae bacterium]
MEDDFLKGGAHELSGVLERRTKEDPERFAHLLLRFPDDTHPYYFDAVLRGIAEAGVSTETLLEVCRRCHKLPDRPSGRWICDAVEKAADRPLPKELLEIVAWYATEDSDPEQELWRTDAGNGQPYYGGDILTTGINSTRGRAAEAMADLIFRDADRTPIFSQTLEKMVEDPSIGVRTCVSSALTAVLNHDRNLAVELFKRLCDTEDVLLGTRGVEIFLFYAARTHFGQLKPILERMLSSSDADVAAAGAGQACVASLNVEEVRPLAEKCLSGTEAQREGAAEVYSVNLQTARYRSVCEDALAQLFDDESQNVRSAASKCFLYLGEDQLGQYARLIEAFIQSDAFAAEHGQLIHALEQTTDELPQESVLACERFLDIVGGDAADIQTSAASHADDVVQILVRTYNQSRNPEMQARCLNLFDRMAEFGIHGVSRALDQYER